jgi:hypothetical protein
MATYVLIATASPTGTTVTFSSIPQTYKDLVIKYSVAEVQGGGGYSQGAFKITFNGDSTTKYSETRLTGGNGTVLTSRRSSSSWTQFNFYNGNNSTANIFSNSEIYIPNYISTSAKSFFTFDVQEDSNASNSNAVNIDAQLYTGTSAITSITLTDANGQSLVSGSKVYLYGI